MGDVGALAGGLLGDGMLRDRFAADPPEVLAEFGVTTDELGSLAAMVEERARHLPAAERRAAQALVFLALAARDS
jgi:hypothetical protein